MARVRIVLSLLVFCAILAIVILGRPLAPPNLGPAPAIAATPSPTRKPPTPTPTPSTATFSSSCQGTITIAGVAKPFTKVASTIVNLATFSFVGTETDVENGTPVTFSFTGTFGPGPGPVPGGTFTTTQTACASCSTGTCATILMCMPLVGHPELATQHFTGVTEEKMTEASFESNETVAKDRTILCRSSTSP